MFSSNKKRRLAPVFVLLLDLYFYFTKLTPFTTPTFEIFYRVWSQDFGWFLGGKGA